MTAAAVVKVDAMKAAVAASAWQAVVVAAAAEVQGPELVCVLSYSHVTLQEDAIMDLQQETRQEVTVGHFVLG